MRAQLVGQVRHELLVLAIGTGMERDKVLHHPGDLDYIYRNREFSRIARLTLESSALIEYTRMDGSAQGWMGVHSHDPSAHLSSLER